MNIQQPHHGLDDPPWPTMPTLKPAQTKLARLCCGPAFGVYVDGKCATCGRPCDVQQSSDKTEFTPLRHVEPPIARAEHIQQMIRGLRRDRDMYRKLLADTEQALADYEVMAGVPF